MKFKNYILEEDIERIIKKISPKTTLVRKGTSVHILKGPDGEAKVWRGASDKQWRMKFRGDVEKVVDLKNGIEIALKVVDSNVAQKEFKKLAAIAKAGEVEEE